MQMEGRGQMTWSVTICTKVLINDAYESRSVASWMKISQLAQRVGFIMSKMKVLNGENMDLDQCEAGWWIQDGAGVNMLRGRCIRDNSQRTPASLSHTVLQGGSETLQQF